jgi:hypothetical protein
MESIDGDLRKLMSQGVKQAGFGVRNPVEWADEVYQTSKSACAELTDAMVNHNRLHLGKHQKTVKQAATHAGNMRIADEEAYLGSEVISMGQATRWRHKQAQAMPNRWNGTEIPAEQFFDNVRLRINKKPLFMPDKCDGCGARMDVEHALSCKVGGLVHIRHDDVANEWGHLSGLAFSPSCVSHEPRINMSETAAERQSAQENVTNPPQQETRSGRRPRRQQRNADLGDVPTCEDEREDNTHAPYAVSTENRADKGVHGFWKRGRLCLFDVRITDTECRSTRN